ncbi:hypothetical protein CEB3_c05200 [Peptococcaceae bacterium CEB3]|nr:hypothetical protein CEB3_c05200 [Peptococcaceae bacterium CEB3]
MKKFVIRLVTVIFALLIMVQPAFAATSSGYSWNMPYPGYVVNGKANGVLHNLPAGTLVDSGQLCEYAELQGAVGPYDINIAVYKEGILWDTEVSSQTVTPSATLNQNVSYSHNAGTISAGTYYVFISKVNGATDGWSTEGTGTLSVN